MKSRATQHALIGRDEVVSRVASHLLAREPCVLVGASGIGKSTISLAAAAATSEQVFVGGGLATLDWMTYLPLRRALGAAPGAGDEAHVADEVAERVGEGVLVLDDLQWADDATRRVLELLAGRVRLLVVVRTDDPGGVAALDLCDRLGAVRIQPEPLDDAAAHLLLRTRRGDVPEPEAERIVAGAGGNPLFLLELAADGAMSTSFHLALAARIRSLSTDGRDALALLALLGRPAPPALLGPGATELVAREFADEIDGAVAVRHSLFAEVAAAELDDETRRALHARLAESVDEAAEAAHHYAAAGMREQAAPLALAAARAAATQGERAELLALMATTCAPEERTEMSFEAARELSAAGRYAEAERLLDALGPLAGLDRARAAAVRWGTRYELGDLAGAHAEVAAGLAADGLDTELDTELHLAGARLANLDESTAAEERLAKATAAAQLARRNGIFTARAAYLLGTTLYVCGDGRCIEELARAREEGQAGGDVESELTAGYNLIAACEAFCEQERGRELAVEMTARATELHMTAWVRHFRVAEANLDLHAGRYGDVLRKMTALLSEGLDPRRNDAVDAALSVALIDLGRFAEAAESIARLRENGAHDVRGQGLALWLQAEADLWGGRPRAALAAVEQFLGREDAGIFEPFGRVVEAWALLELGRAVPDSTKPALMPIQYGIPVELEGLRVLAGGSALEAAGLLRRAAELNAAGHLRGELRCLLGAALALREAGQRSDAKELLLALEARAEAHRMTPLLARIRRALRLVGVRRAAPRGRSESGLTAREAEVLELASDGLTSAAIAARLGVGHSTVKTLSASAARKLGASTRREAVARFIRG